MTHQTIIKGTDALFDITFDGTEDEDIANRH